MSVKRSRRTRAEVAIVKDAIRAALEVDAPMTVRQMFYRLVTLDVIDKTEKQYKQLCQLLTNMRRAKEIPYGSLTDGTRFVRRPYTVPSLAFELRNTAEVYRRAIWDNQNAYVEVWLEKDALRGVLEPITDKWDVPLQISRGYASLSFLHGAAADIEQEDKPTFIYYFGDHDPSGVNIPRTIEKTLREMTPSSDITFTRVAVLPEQIASLDLPTRPTKTSDPRSKGFEGESVEVDAIPVSQIREMVNDCIIRHLDPRAYSQLLTVEDEERETLRSIAAAYEEGRT